MADRQYVGPYQVTGRAPAGRALEAYEAVDVAGTAVVVKLVAPPDRGRFFALMRALSAVDHPNLARVLDWGAEGDLCYVVQEAVEGTDLAALAALQGHPAATVIADLGAQAAAALAALHARGIVHGGLTPVTMVRTGDGTLKVTDAGLATVAGQADLSDADPPEAAYFVSPEEVLTLPVTPRSDIYALGACLYAVAVGCVPFDGANALEVAHKHVGAAPEAPRSLRPDLPAPFVRTLFRTLAKQPEHRHASADELRRELEASALGLSQPTAPPPAPAAGPRTPVWPWVIGLAIVAVVLAAIWLPGAFEGEGVTVPDVVGMSLDDARQALVDAGLVLGALTPDESDATAPQGTVLGQTPAAGSEVDRGSAVDLVIAGAGIVVMPDVTGLTQADAEAAVIAAGLSVARILPVYSEDVPAGSVVAQDPAAGASVPQGTAVTLSVSSGVQSTASPGASAVPNVVGMTQAAALAALQQAGYTAVTTTEASDTTPAGQVTRQTPQAGVLAAPGTSVTITVSTGPTATP